MVAGITESTPDRESQLDVIEITKSSSQISSSDCFRGKTRGTDIAGPESKTASNIN
jgi:hypothetical protein